MTKQIGPLLTVSDLDLMPDDGKRYELIEGELIVSRAPGLTHQDISGNLITELKNFIRRNPIGKVWATPGLILSDSDAVIPDIVFVETERLNEIVEGERLTGAPDLVIEILSPGAENSRRDRVAKRQLYGKYGVKEYWVIDAENRTIEIYRLKGHLLDLAAIITEQEEINSPLLPGFSCSADEIFG